AGCGRSALRPRRRRQAPRGARDQRRLGRGGTGPERRAARARAERRARAVARAARARRYRAGPLPAARPRVARPARAARRQARPMFSGIVKGIGSVLGVDERGGDRRLSIGIAGTPIPPPGIGASIAVNGACLTAAAVGADRFETDVSRETLAVTTLGLLAPG